MNTSTNRKPVRTVSNEIKFETLEPRNMLAADLSNLAFADVGRAGLIYQLSESVPVEQRIELLRHHSGMSETGSWQLQKVTSDGIGFTHFKYQQLEYGIPVEYGQMTVHARDGMIESLSGNYVHVESVDPGTALHERDAFIKALDYVTAELETLDRHHHGDIDGHRHEHDHDTAGVHEHDHAHEAEFEFGEELVFAWQLPNGEVDMSSLPAAELMISQTVDGVFSPTYKFDIYVYNPLFKADIFVDANTGEIIKEREGIHSINTPGSGTAYYTGNVPITVDSFGANPDYRLRINPTTGLPAVNTYDLQNGSSYSSAVDVVSSTTSFNNPNDSIGVQTHYGAEKAIEYYANVHNRNSFSGFGTPLNSYFSLLTGYNNAFWDGIRLTFGDGDGVNFDPLVSIDVVAHELTHGVIDYSGAMEYYYEPGALNESFADIFGEAIEHYATGSNDWLIGEEFILSGPPIRDLANPDSLGDPGTYLGNNWYFGNNDNGGVHTNSTVQSHWFHILSEGKTGTNDNGDSYDVRGIGIEDAAAIAYRNLTTYMGVTSQYQDARVGSIQSAVDLFGVESPQHLSTEAAWDAVGVYGFDLHFQPKVVANSVGSLIYEDRKQSEVYFPGIVEETAIRVDAGQSITIAAESATLLPSLTIKDPAGNVVDSVVGTGSKTILQSAPVAVSGEYTIEIGGAAGTTGVYDIDLILNSGLEHEVPGVHSNNTMGTAEDLDATSIPLGNGAATRLGVTAFMGEGAIVYGGDDFESGTFGPQWTLSSSQPDGRIENWGGPGTHSGTQAMIMHQLPQGPFNLNEAVLSVDLAGVTGARLKFWVAEWHDESHYLPFGSFTGSADGDGVSLSVDGNTWYPLLDYIETPYSEYVYYEFDLDSFAAGKGITLGSNVQFKFQQYDNDSIYSDGIGFDDIEISVPNESEDWYSFTLNAGESASIVSSVITGNQDLNVELYDSGGNLLQTGTVYENQSAISQFVNTGATDTYFVRAVGTSLDYNLVVTRGADYDIEPNGVGNPQDISDVAGVLGSVFRYRTVAVDPDSFNDGAILDTAIANLTFSNDINGGSVWSADTDEIFNAPTGTRVFAPDFGAADGWRETENELRVDFAALQTTVSIDVGSDDNEDIGWLKAYSSSGLLLEQKQSSGIPFGFSQTLTIDRPQADIAYVVASGFDFHITPMDNLQYTDYTTDDDYYLISAIAGDQIDLQGILPSDGDFEFENGLDSPSGSMLGMELFDPAGNLVAAGNQLINHLALENGDYTLRVFAQEGEGEYFISRQVSANPLDVPLGGQLKFLDGVAGTGDFNDTIDSNDVYKQLLPSPTSNPYKQKIDMVGQALTIDSNPTSFGFRLEAKMNGGPAGDVMQRIQLFNEQTNQWDLLDLRAASATDTVVEVYATGDLTDYIHPLTGEITVNLTWTSLSFSGTPFAWTIDIDQAGWLIH